MGVLTFQLHYTFLQPRKSGFFGNFSQFFDLAKRTSLFQNGLGGRNFGCKVLDVTYEDLKFSVRLHPLAALIKKFFFIDFSDVLNLFHRYLSWMSYKIGICYVDLILVLNAYFSSFRYSFKYLPLLLPLLRKKADFLLTFYSPIYLNSSLHIFYSVYVLLWSILKGYRRVKKTICLRISKWKFFKRLFRYW